jgi:hypothetical protein
MFEIVSSISPVLKLIENTLKSWDSTINPTFDPQLSYETSLDGLRNYKMNLDLKKDSVFPIFAYNRTCLAPAHPLGLRATEMQAIKTDSESGTIYIGTMGEFTLNFLYIHPNMSSIERFEILYNAQLGLKEKHVTLNLNTLGDFQYQLYWELLNPNIQTSAINNAYFTMIGGAVLVRGMFLAIQEVLPVITHWNVDVYPSYLHYRFKWDQIYPTDIDLTNNTIDVIESWETNTPLKFTRNLDAQSLPSPLIEGQEYYAINVSAGKVQIAEHPNSDAIVLTDIGDVSTGSYFIMAVSL